MKKDKRKDKFYKAKGLHGLAALSFEKLIRLQGENEQHQFNETMEQILPDVNSYIARNLSAAVRNGNLPSGKYTVEDFTDELYLRTYDQISEVEDEKELHPWLFKKADELLEERISEEAQDELFFENIDNYTREEWNRMQTAFGVDGEGELLLLEEFDDPSYPLYEYQLSDAFLEENPEEKWLEALNEELGDAQIHQHIDMVLHRLPARVRSVYDLAVNQRFKPYEIAKIKRISVYQVEKYVKQAKESIQKSLESRYKD